MGADKENSCKQESIKNPEKDMGVDVLLKDGEGNENMSKLNLRRVNESGCPDRNQQLGRFHTIMFFFFTCSLLLSAPPEVKQLSSYVTSPWNFPMD